MSKGAHLLALADRFAWRERMPTVYRALGHRAGRALAAHGGVIVAG